MLTLSVPSGGAASAEHRPVADATGPSNDAPAMRLDDGGAWFPTDEEGRVGGRDDLRVAAFTETEFEADIESVRTDDTETEVPFVVYRAWPKNGNNRVTVAFNPNDKQDTIKIQTEQTPKSNGIDRRSSTERRK